LGSKLFFEFFVKRSRPEIFSDGDPAAAPFIDGARGCVSHFFLLCGLGAVIERCCLVIAHSFHTLRCCTVFASDIVGFKPLPVFDFNL
jgi:hypothetical protein